MGLFLAPLKNDLPGDKFRYQYEGLSCHLQAKQFCATNDPPYIKYTVTSDNPVAISPMFQMGGQCSQKNEANIKS